MNILQIIFTSLLTIFFMLIVIFLIVLMIFFKFNKKKDKVKNYTNTKQKNATTLLIRTKKITYDIHNNPFEKTVSYKSIYNKLVDVLNNDNIKKIYIDVDNFNLSLSQVEEFESIFKKLNEKKEVISCASILTNETYEIAMLANKIYLENTVNSTVIFKAYHRKMFYIKNLLRQIGLNIDVIHVGDYKSYGETYSKDKMSTKARENITRLYDKKFDMFVEKVKDKRNYDIRQDILDGNFFFKDNDKIIDSRKNKIELYENEDNLIELNDYVVKEKKNKSKNEIAIITLEGIISPDELSLNKVIDKLKKLDDYKNLKAIVLEINSPGGSAYESSLIHSYIKNNIELPIYVAMKNVSASGGYFISTVANKIYANKNTLTGSIGVVAMYPNTTKLIKNLYIKNDGISKGKTAEYGDINDYLRQDTKEMLVHHIREIYKEFKSVVMQARNMTDEVLEPIAQGKVWLGQEAVKIGLVDGIKNTNEVIEQIKADLKLKDVKLIYVEQKFKINEYMQKKLSFVKYKALLCKPVLLSPFHLDNLI